MPLLENLRGLLKGVQTVAPVRHNRRLSRGQVRQAQDDMPSRYITDILEAVDISPDPPREEGGHMHASTLLNNPCVRAFALEQKYKPNYAKVVNRGQRVIWTLGRAAERHVRDSLIKGMPEAVYGLWRCACGHTKLAGTASFAYANRKCGKCRLPITRYVEHTLVDEQRGVMGNPDLLFKFGSPLTVVECKSINDKGFAELVKEDRPNGDNACQALYYRRMAQRSGLAVSDYAIILYVLKDYKWNQSPYREFRVREQDRGYAANLNMMDRVADDINKVRKGECGMPKRLAECTSCDSKKAKVCKVCALCFSL